MTTESIERLFVEGLQELYDTEQKLVEALDNLSEQTNDEAASQAFEEHREETQEHVDRLEQVFEQIGEEPETREDPVVTALIDEHERFAGENEGDVLDRYNMEVGQETEHYEIATYGSLTSLAGKAGYDEAADLLAETLREEEQALEQITQASEQFDEQQVASN